MLLRCSAQEKKRDRESDEERKETKRSKKVCVPKAICHTLGCVRPAASFAFAWIACCTVLAYTDRGVGVLLLGLLVKERQTQA